MTEMKFSKIYIWVGTFSEGWISVYGELTSESAQARRFSAAGVDELLGRNGWTEGTSAQTGRTTYRLDPC